jgi:hypothetical protein
VVPKPVGARRATLALAALALGMPLAALQPQQKVDMRRAVTSDVSLRIVGGFASLKIIGWSKDSVVITGTLPKGARLEGGFGGNSAEPARIGKMYIETPEDAGGVRGALEMRVPERARVWAKSGSADLEATGITGGLDLNIVGGSIRVNGSPRELNAESMDGQIVVEGSPAWVRLKTAAGDITMRGGSTDAAFTTVSGAVRISDGALERTRIESVTGGVFFGGDFARGASLTVDTHSGPVELRLARPPDAEFDLATVAGSIENQLSRMRPTKGREGRGEELGISLGSGNARVVIRSCKGNIRLASR